MRQIADALKDFAYKDHVPIIAVAQTNRAAVQKGGGRGEAPGTEHLFGGDVLGWNADLVLSLYRTNEMYVARQMGLSMVKYRHGEEMNMLLKWDLEEGIIQYEASVSRGESIKDAMKQEHSDGIPDFQD
jgi:replicative DNA helicase